MEKHQAGESVVGRKKTSKKEPGLTRTEETPPKGEQPRRAGPGDLTLLPAERGISPSMEDAARRDVTRNPGYAKSLMQDIDDDRGRPTIIRSR